MGEVGLMALKHIGGYMPFLHDELVWNVEPVENKVEYVDVVSGGFSFDVDELERTEVPVAGNNQRMLLCIAEAVGGMEQGGQRPKAKE